MTLDQLPKNHPARIQAISGDDAALEAKLREIGFAEGDEVEFLHTSLFGLPPRCYRLNATQVALRKSEAMLIHVEPIQ